MAQFILLIRGGYEEYQDASPEAIQQHLDKYRAWSTALRQRGQYVTAEKLCDDGGGRVVGARQGQVVDGPFTETKETIGGYFVIEAADYAEAVAIARGCPILSTSDGSVEVRQIEPT